MAEAAQSPLVELFGAQVQGKSGPVATESMSSMELVGIYFSAHWCPPCKQFTPRLIECYNKVNANGKRFEIVFVSADQTQGEFNGYYGEQPWVTTGFQAPINDALNKKYRVQGIPTLVFIDPQTGKTVTKDGRSAVMSDLDGNRFPWTPKPFWEMMGDAEIVAKNGPVVSATQLKEELAGGYLGVYFSAHWCGPCRQFTPQLIQWYNTKKDSLGVPFDIVFASSDHTGGEFEGYYGSMPWRAIPYENRGLKEELSSSFGVRGIPTFAIVEVNTGKTITTTGRMGLMTDPEAFPWAPKAHGVLSQAFIQEIESTPFLLLFAEDDGKSQVDLLAKEGAVVQAKRDETGEFDMILCTVAKDMGLRGRLRQIMKLGEDGTKLVILDLTEGQFYAADVTDANAIDQQTIDDFVAAYRAGSLTATRLAPP